MKAVILFFFAATTISFSSYAQFGKKGNYTHMMSHGIGISFQKFDGLNDRIAGLPQYKTLRDYTGTLQLGFLKERNRLISEMGLIAGSSMSGDRDEKSSTIRFLGINVNIGYDVVPNNRIMLYPFVGLGYEMYQARFFKDNSSVAFNDVLQSPTVQNNIRPVDFKNGFFTYRAGFGVLLSSPKNNHGSIGLQAGYTGSFNSRTWRSSHNQSLLNAPEDNLSRFFVALIFSKRHAMK